MKTVYIIKLQPYYKEYVLSREPANFQEANNYAAALQKRKNQEGVTQKPTTMFAIESDFGLNQNSNLSEEEREICINAVKTAGTMDKTLDKRLDFQTTAATQVTQTHSSPNPNRIKRKRRILLPSNAGFATRQAIHKQNAERKNQ